MADRHVDHLLIGGGIASATCAQALREAERHRLDPARRARARPAVSPAADHQGLPGRQRDQGRHLDRAARRRRGADPHLGHGARPGGQDRDALHQGDRRVRHRAAGDRRDGPPAADRRRPARRHPLPARARQRRLADRGRRDGGERGLRRRLLHRLRERRDADDAGQARHGRPAGGGADGARVRPEGRRVGARRAREPRRRGRRQRRGRALRGRGRARRSASSWPVAARSTPSWSSPASASRPTSCSRARPGWRSASAAACAPTRGCAPTAPTGSTSPATSPSTTARPTAAP